MPPTARMQKQLEKLEKDTYAVRRLEGRPKHGQTSLTVMGLGGLSWFIFLTALVLPEWRANWSGILGYPHKRSWGLFSVVGMQSKMHHETMTDACRFYSQLNVMGMCMSPVCLWYRTKCQIYMDMAMISYSAAFFFFCCLALHSLCLVWTVRMTPRMIKWAAIWWVAQVIMHVSVLVFWVMMLGESFDTLDNGSMYPTPDFSFCFFLECFGILLLCITAMMGITLMKMWPESSGSSDTSTDSDEEDDEDASDEGAPLMQQGGPPMMGPGGQPMMGPGGQPMMGPPGGPPMMGQPGYGPPMGGPPPQGFPQQEQQGFPQQQQGWDGQQQQQQQGFPQQQQGFPQQQQGFPQQQEGFPQQQQGWEGQQQQQQQQQGWNPGMSGPAEPGFSPQGMSGPAEPGFNPGAGGPPAGDFGMGPPNQQGPPPNQQQQPF